MEDDELEGIRNKELRGRLQKYQQARELEMQKKFALKYIVDAQAYERLMNVRLANSALYDQIVSLLIYLYQNKQVKGKVTDEQLKEILAKLTARKESEITFKKK
ncbi:MAG: DNA-binding protein [Candidatus Micrarchaeota archaeon]|nr:DNA-binding protein [Candidatus Micrarchaeota archaeon]